MNKGYIGITDNNWVKFIKENNINNVNFWCKKRSFRAINEGDIFFFLKKNNNIEKKEKRERKLVGYGIFRKFEVLSINDAWNEYGIGNGCRNIEVFSDKINSMYKLMGEGTEIGSIILDEVTMFEEPLYLSKLGIEFANAIVSGKAIDIEQVNKILNTLEVKVEYVEVDENEYIEDYTLNEGERIKRIINARKRNSKARKLKLEQFKKDNGKVFCEVCKEEDIFTLDVHHDFIQVADMEEGHKTKLSELRVICANCHRKVHGYNICVDELMNK